MSPIPMSLLRRTLYTFAMLAAAAPLFAAVLTPAIYILEEGEVEDEDVYIATSSARVDGVINGDLVIAAGAVDIGGTVNGDVLLVSHGRLVITGMVDGSVRGTAREVVIDGIVTGDVAAATGSLHINGVVGRDVLTFAGVMRLNGSIERDLLGRFIDGNLDGTVGRDVDVSVRSLSIGPNADVGGDLLYRADSDADVATGAEVAGQFERLPSRAVFIVRVWLIGATIIGFLAFIGSGFLLFLIFRSTLARATGIVRTEPWRSLWVGALAIVLLPLISVILLFTIVGAPIGILAIILWILGLVFAPVPAVAAGGDLLLRGKGGIFAAFFVGAAIWRLGIWLIPFVGVLLYTAALAAGSGAMVLASWRQRQAGAAAATPLFPTPQGPEPNTVDDWEPPLAPMRPAARESEPPDTTG